jgi:outer membrane lipoprotein-sorting protein
MPPNNEELERYYEQFGRDHERLREELLVAIPSCGPVEPAIKRRLWDGFRWAPSAVRWRRVAGYAAAALAVIIASIVALNDGPASVTYANVLARVERVRSVQYTKTLVRPVEAQQRVRVRVLGRYLERQEHLGPDGSIMGITIINLQTGAIVAIYPQDRRFEILSRQRTILPDDSDVVEAVKPAPWADIYNSIREVPPDAAPTFPERELNGRQVIGFYHEVKSGGYLWQNTYWVDVETMLPVQVEKRGQSQNGQWESMEWLWDDIVFDEDLDQSLFSTEPPDGYTAEEAEIQGFQMPAR